MARAARTLDLTLARRLAVSRQRLAGAPPANGQGPEAIMSVAADLGGLQLDPSSVVARSHQLVLWSRLGRYDRGDLEGLLWRERRLVEYWTHAAAIVCTDDYPIHSLLMRRYPSARHARMRAWLAENQALRRSILRQLRAGGPLPTRALEDRSQTAWRSSGWTAGRNVDRMLDVLWTQGRIMVAGRQGQQRVWDLAQDAGQVSASHTPCPDFDKALAHARRAYLAGVLALAPGLGLDPPPARARDRPPGRPAQPPGPRGGDGPRHRPPLHRRPLPRAGRRPGRTGAGGPSRAGPPGRRRPRASRPLVRPRRRPASAGAPGGRRLAAADHPALPFDNLIINRERTERLFGFHYRMEIYVPKAARRFGYYVLPVLHGDRLIGRVDPAMDRASGRLVVNAVHAEPDAAAAAGPAVAAAIGELAAFLGAGGVELRQPPPALWRRAFA